MKVFLSWSGPKSKAMAEATNEWLQCVLQSLTPWISTKDIERGSLWFAEISNQLNDTGIGIIFLTRSNKNSPWIMFESGALAKGLSTNRVCTFLVDLNPQDINNPLANFNHTFPEKNSIYYLVSMLNNMLGEKGLDEKVLDKVFEKYWPDFSSEIERINKEYKDDAEEPERDPDDILTEILLTTRSFSKRISSLENEVASQRIFETAKNKIKSDLRHSFWISEDEAPLSESDRVKRVRIVDDHEEDVLSSDRSTVFLKRGRIKKDDSSDTEGT